MANIKGRSLVFKIGTSPAVIASATDYTVNYGGVPIDVTNHGSDGWMTTLADEQDSKQWTVTGNFTFDNSTELDEARAAALDGSHVNGEIVWVGSGGSTDQTVTCSTWSVSGYSSAGPATGACTETLTIASSGTATYAAAADA